MDKPSDWVVLTQQLGYWPEGWVKYLTLKFNPENNPIAGFVQRYLPAIRTYFTRWLIRTNSYDLSKPQWRVGLGAGFGVGHSYKFIWIGNS